MHHPDDFANLRGAPRPPTEPGHGFGHIFSAPDSPLGESDYRHPSNRAPGSWETVDSPGSHEVVPR